MRLRIATYNIRRGGGRRHRHISDVLAELKADVVVLQEAIYPETVRLLAEATGARALVQGPGRSIAVLSRLGDLRVRWLPLSRGRTFADVELEGAGIRLLGVHLAAGLSRRGERLRAREIEHVLVAGARQPGPGRTIITGDLNAIAPGDALDVGRLPTWIRLLLRIDGGIETGVVRHLLDAGYVDAYRVLHPRTSGATMPAVAPSVRLDYILLGAALAPAVIDCDIGMAAPALLAAASDHIPVVVDLDLGDPPE